MLISLLFSATQLHFPYFGIGDREFMAAAFFVSGYYTALCKRGLAGLSFYSIGLAKVPYSQHRLDLSATSFNMLRNATLIVLLFVVVLVASLLMPMGMLTLTVRGVVPYFAAALCGIFMTMIISQLVDKHLPIGRFRNAIIFIGDHTMEILTWHMLSFKLVSLLIIWIEQRPIEQLACFPVIPADITDVNYFTPWWPVYLISGMAIPLVMVKIM